MKKLPPVVLGGGITGLGVVRSLGKAGLYPHLVCEPGDFAARSRWVRGRTLELEDTLDIASLVRELTASRLESAVLIPCTDPWCHGVVELPESASQRYPTSMPSRETVELLLDKWLLSRKLEELGVPHPATYELTDEAQLSDATPPIFLKPRSSGHFFDAFKRKAVRFRDRDDAVKAFRAMARAGYSAVLQEYVPGPPSAHFFVDGFVDRKGVCRGRLVRRRLRMFPVDFGNSSMTATVSPDTASDALESLDTLLTGLRYRGAFNAEFKRDPRDGVAKLIEMNCRPWWFIDFAAHCGIDVSLMIYRDALGLDIATVDGYAIGERCGVLVDDIKAYRALRGSGELSFADWVGSWGGATSSTFEAYDPLPTLASLAEIGRRNVARRLRTAKTGV